MEFGVRDSPTVEAIGVFPAVTENMALVQLKAVPQPVVAVQAVKAGGFALVTLTVITPKPGVSRFGIGPVLA